MLYFMSNVLHRGIFSAGVDTLDWFLGWCEFVRD